MKQSISKSNTEMYSIFFLLQSPEKEIQELIRDHSVSFLIFKFTLYILMRCYHTTVSLFLLKPILKIKPWHSTFFIPFLENECK